MRPFLITILSIAGLAFGGVTFFNLVSIDRFEIHMHPNSRQEESRPATYETTPNTENYDDVECILPTDDSASCVTSELRTPDKNTAYTLSFCKTILEKNGKQWCRR